MSTVADKRRDDPRTAVEAWRRCVAKRGGRVGFWHHAGESGWQGVTWSEADTAAREVAAGLVAAGIAPGDRVAILAQTRIEWTLADVGILLAGAVTVPIYGSNTAEQCEYILDNAGARAVIVEDAAQLEKVAAARARLPELRFVVVMAGDAVLEKPDARGRTQVTMAEASAGLGDWMQMWPALRERGRAWNLAHPDDLAGRDAALGPESIFTIIYTSGTTGNPKGVVLTHDMLVAACASACRAFTLLEDDNHYLFLPLAHVLARELEWAGVLAGYTTWFSRGIPKIKDDLGDVRPTFMTCVPRVLEKFYGGVQAAAKQGSPTKRKLVAWAFARGAAFATAKRAGQEPGFGLGFGHALAEALVLKKLRTKLGLDRCRFLISGGAPLAAEIAEFFQSVGLLVLEGYGLTETMAAAFVNRVDAYRFGTVGPAIDVVDSKIAEDGEILVRGPSVFKQYFKNPEATAEAIDADGWFHTGDIGHLEDGFLRITDRKKDIIVTAGGKKVAPQPMENALKARSPLLSQVVVFGDKKPFCVALVTLSEEAARRFGAGDLAAAAASEAAQAEVGRVFAALNATLPSYETIKTFRILPIDFGEASGELTPSLKVKRKVVAERYKDVIEGLYR